MAWWTARAKRKECEAEREQSADTLTDAAIDAAMSVRTGCALGASAVSNIVLLSTTECLLGTRPQLLLALPSPAYIARRNQGWCCRSRRLTSSIRRAGANLEAPNLMCPTTAWTLRTALCSRYVQ